MEMIKSHSSQNAIIVKRNIYRKLSGWILLVLVITFLLSGCSGLQPQRVVCREYPEEVRPTPEELFLLPDVRTPLPPEMVANREQTNGVLMGGIALVIIVIGGTLSVIRQNR